MHAFTYAVVAGLILKGIVAGSLAYHYFGLPGAILSGVILPLVTIVVLHLFLEGKRQEISRTLLNFSYRYLSPLPERVADKIATLARDHLTEEQVTDFLEFVHWYSNTGEKIPADFLRRIGVMWALMEAKCLRVQKLSSDRHSSTEEAVTDCNKSAKTAYQLYSLLSRLMDLQKTPSDKHDYWAMRHIHNEICSEFAKLDSMLRKDS